MPKAADVKQKCNVARATASVLGEYKTCCKGIRRTEMGH